MYSVIEKYDDRDYIEELAGSIESSATFSNIKYNQNLVDPFSCTGQSSCGVISDVTDYAISLSNRKNVWARQLKTGAIEGRGDYLVNGIKQAVKEFNEDNPELPFYLEYYRLKNIQSDNLLNVLEFSSVVTGFTGKLLEDSQDNGVIDNLDNEGGSGHSIRIVKGWKEGNKMTIKYCDNYEGVNKYNIITVPNFLNNKNFFLGGYYLRKIYKNK